MDDYYARPDSLNSHLAKMDLKMDTTRSENLAKVREAWLETLKHFNIDRPVLPFEEMSLSRLVQQYDWKSVLYAVIGMRFEEKTQTFNPAKYVGLRRLDDPTLFERFVNLASQKKTEQKKRDQK